jgi:hypothetical protein
MNRVRLIVEIGGSFYTGSQLGKILPKYLPVTTTPPPELTGWKKFKWVTDEVRRLGFAKPKLWLIREPRRIAYQRSRYVNFQQAMGLGRDLRKKKKKSHYAETTRGVQLRRPADDRGAEPLLTGWPQPTFRAVYARADARGNTPPPAAPERTIRWTEYDTGNIFIQPDVPGGAIATPEGAQATGGELRLGDVLRAQRPDAPGTPEVQRGVVGIGGGGELVAQLEPSDQARRELAEALSRWREVNPPPISDDVFDDDL